MQELRLGWEILSLVFPYWKPSSLGGNAEGAGPGPRGVFRGPGPATGGGRGAGAAPVNHESREVQMKVTVKPKVVGGVRRGGEDLLLVFEATGEPDGEFVVELVAGNPSWCLDDDDDEQTGVWCCTTDNYEFEWRGTQADLHKLAQEAGVTSVQNWEWYGSVSEQPKKRFLFEHFVAGNAD